VPSLVEQGPAMGLSRTPVVGCFGTRVVAQS
jgi:hypothetical protein